MSIPEGSRLRNTTRQPVPCSPCVNLSGRIIKIEGAGAPLSAGSIQRLKAKWEGEYEAWRSEDLSSLEPVYIWADGVYVKAGIGRDKAALLVVISALSDGTKRVLAVESGYRESKESWAGVLRSLKGRGSEIPRLIVADYPRAVDTLYRDLERMVM